MIAVTALRLAGPGGLLVARPHGVPHVYVGPTTPSGRFIPRAARTVCKAHTRRLGVIPPGALPADARVCARCSARLTRSPRPVSRDEWRARFSHVTLDDLTAELAVANTERWVATLGHLALLLHGHAACARPIPGRNSNSFNDLLGQRRRAANPKLSLLDGPRQRANAEIARNARAAQRADIHADNEARIARLGINLAKPVKKK